MQGFISRREFVRASSGAAVAAGLGLAAAPARAQANDRIRIGCIGIGGRGTALQGELLAQPDVEIVAVADVRDDNRAAAIARAGGNATGYKDFRELLARDDVDAVAIATPPHWHALIGVYALKAGKDIYVEKPMGRYPAEIRALVKAAKEGNRITQVGTQIHAGENFHRVVEIVRSGVLGKITAARILITLNEAPGGCGKAPDSDPPPGVDWDMWLGPAPYVPFNPTRFTVHRYFKDYCGSWLTELGPHIGEPVFWALDLPAPRSALAVGGKFTIDDISDIPDTMDAIWEYPDLNVTYISNAANSYTYGFGAPPDGGRRLSVLFHGVNGTLAADYGANQIIAEGNRMDGAVLPDPTLPRSPGHMREFLDSVKSRQETTCNAQHHYGLHIAMALAHISYWTGRQVRWDDETGHIPGDPEADAIAQAPYREPWKLPA